MNFHPQARSRHLVLVLGDQLNQDSAAFDGFDPACDAVWMAEVAEESTHVWSHKARIAMFLSAMRHFRDSLRERGWTVHYRQLSEAANSGNFRGELTATTSRLCPQRLIWVEPGEWGVQTCLESTARTLGVDFEVRPDRHFFCSREEFARHAAGRKQLRMEFFYREMRQKHHVLMDGDEPAGGAWNFDSDNRESFRKDGPDTLRPQPRRFEPDAVTREVIALVNEKLAKHPGMLDDFDWPVTPADAELALQDFMKHRLAEFGRWQDAMWTNEPWLFHSRLSAAMNLKLLHPRRVIAAAEKAWRSGCAPLAAVQQTCGAALSRITAPVLDENGAPLSDTGRYYHREGNSCVVRGMAAGLTLRTETTGTDARALLGEYDRVLSTAPLPQTAALFGQTISAEYIPCLTVLLAYRGGPTGLCREAYALSDHTSDLAWSACENHKPGRIATGCTVMVAQMSEAFSRTHLESPPADYPALVRAMVERRWGLSSANFLAALGHRWRYARVAQPHAEPPLPDRCYFAGDVLAASRVEDAWLAGRAAALKIIQSSFLANTTLPICGMSQT